MIPRIARFALLLAVLSAVAVALSGPGYRIGWWPLPVAFTLLRWATYAALGVAALALVVAIIARMGSTRPGLGASVAAIVIGVATSIAPLLMMARAKEVPPIHDITTDTDDPPQFVAALPLRVGAPNPTVYAGAALAAEQKQAFPQVVPVQLAMPPAQAWQRSLAAAQKMGWVIVGSAANDGRIEATDTTPFFGFSDDVVIRVRPIPSGSRIDIRSLSRIGRSDMGVNARRIERYLDRLRNES
ncbi:MAG: DUF1499 domain-containing protein [Betaproteobacteria bacterium]